MPQKNDDYDDNPTLLRRERSDTLSQLYFCIFYASQWLSNGKQRDV